MARTAIHRRRTGKWPCNGWRIKGRRFWTGARLWEGLGAPAAARSKSPTRCGWSSTQSHSDEVPMSGLRKACPALGWSGKALGQRNLAELLQEMEGILIKTMGDSLMVVFRTASAAPDFALEFGFHSGCKAQSPELGTNHRRCGRAPHSVSRESPGLCRDAATCRSKNGSRRTRIFPGPARPPSASGRPGTGRAGPVPSVVSRN